MSGVDLVTVKELLTHKYPDHDLRYAHLASTHKVRAVGILDKAVRHIVRIIPDT